MKNITALFKRYLDDQCSPEEIKVLLKHFGTEENQTILKKLIREELERMPAQSAVNDPALRGVYQKIQTAIHEQKKSTTIPLYKRVWIRAAAAALIIFAIGTYWWLNQQSFLLTDSYSYYKNDVAPGGKKAILTLADGSQITLDSARIGTLAQQGNTKIIKSDNGRLLYSDFSGLADSPIPKLSQSRLRSDSINTLSTPRGGEYQLTLPDGSQVWLNAASKITFPTQFTGEERRVEIQGEAYFEIAKNGKPFIVKANKRAEIKVLGTHFNVNAYDDESTIRTTLLEGSVSVSSSPNHTVSESLSHSVTLSPGQQSVIDQQGHIEVLTVDPAEVIDWKNGIFIFRDEDIQSIMRKAARWYDVEIVYKEPLPQTLFGGTLSRFENVSELLDVLQLTGTVKFDIEGRKIIVKQD